jgi:hypothetical protein
MNRVSRIYYYIYNNNLFLARFIYHDAIRRHIGSKFRACVFLFWKFGHGFVMTQQWNDKTLHTRV